MDFSFFLVMKCNLLDVKIVIKKSFCMYILSPGFATSVVDDIASIFLSAKGLICKKYITAKIGIKIWKVVYIALKMFVFVWLSTMSIVFASIFYSVGFIFWCLFRGYLKMVRNYKKKVESRPCRKYSQEDLNILLCQDMRVYS